MAELTAHRDEDLVVGAAQAVLDKYEAHSDLSDLVSYREFGKVILQQSLTAFANN